MKRWAGWEIHPRWLQELDLNVPPVVFELDVDAISDVDLPPATLSRQPVVIRDVAVWVDVEVSFQSMLDTLHQAIHSDTNCRW